MADNLVDIDRLTALLKRPAGSLTDDDYTAIITDAASTIVTSTAKQDWTAATAPERAKIIALWLARQAWMDKGNLARRTSGPTSESFFDSPVRGLDLREQDRAWLEGQRPGGGGGLWVTKHFGGPSAGRRRPRYGDEGHDGYSFAAGDWDFAHGMTMSGPADADSW